MNRYLILESQDPLVSRDTEWSTDLATSLARQGSDVTLYLIQNGVLTARKDYEHGRLDATIAAGVEVLADVFSLRERGIDGDRMRDSVRASLLDVVVEQMERGCRVLWH